MEYTQNRELSWLNFNKRVLQVGEDPSTPLFERMKFVAIFQSNLSEFFMIRVAGVKHLVESGIGLACLLDCVTQNAQNFRVLPFEPSKRFDIGLAWKKGRYLSKAASAFMDFCKEALIE